MLTKENLKGLYAGLPLPWKKNGRLDENVFASAVSKVADYRVQGIYNGGSTGEFFAQDFELFKTTTDILIETLKDKKVFTQIGIGALTTEQMVKRGLYAIEKRVDGLQVTFPWYYKVSEKEAIRFYKDLCKEFNNFPIIHYDTGRSRLKLSRNLLSKIYDVYPNLIGVKYTSYDINDFRIFTLKFPEINFFCGHTWLVTFFQFAGALGSYDSYINLPMAVKMYELCTRGKFKEALLIQEKFQRFYIILEENGLLNYTDSAIDRCFWISTGFLQDFSLNVKKPYTSVPKTILDKLQIIIKKEFPEFLEF